jgi:RNA polymerase-binding transcription factor DksA
MTREEMEPHHHHLVALLGRLRRDTSVVTQEALRTAGGEASGGLSNAPLHPADLGTDNFEQELSLGLLENQQQLLEQTLGALDRINAGTYGSCQECKGEIPIERLQAVPYTPFCLECATRLQTAGSEGQLPGNL